MTRLLPETPPRLWPRFSSPLRSTALTARVGRVLGICFTISFVTGMLSHYQYQPWLWLPEPSVPVWGYRLTQGLHVLTGTILIPLLLVKLWSVFPKLFTWPPVGGVKKSLERLSIAVLVASALVELVTGYLNVLNWYPWSWDFVPVHRFLGYVVIGSIILHIAIKLPDIKYGLRTKLAQGDVLTEKPWQENPDAYSNNDDTVVPPPVPSGISRRGVLVASGAGIGLVAVTAAGQTVTPLQSIGLFAVRRKEDATQLALPVNRTAKDAAVIDLARDPSWQLTLSNQGRTAVLTLADVERMVGESGRDEEFPIACVEGWSANAHWRGLRLADVVRLVGGDRDSRIKVTSLEPKGSYNYSFVDGPQVGRALLATHLNGERLTLDHGYPLRLIAPNRAGVLNTKWLHRVEVL